MEFEILCPECGAQLGMQDEVYIFKGGDTVVGCSLCITRQSAPEWHADVEQLFVDGRYVDIYSDMD